LKIIYKFNNHQLCFYKHRRKAEQTVRYVFFHPNFVGEFAFEIHFLDSANRRFSFKNHFIWKIEKRHRARSKRLVKFLSDYLFNSPPLGKKIKKISESQSTPHLGWLCKNQFMLRLEVVRYELLQKSDTNSYYRTTKSNGIFSKLALREKMPIKIDFYVYFSDETLSRKMFPVKLSNLADQSSPLNKFFTKENFSNSGVEILFAFSSILTKWQSDLQKCNIFFPFTPPCRHF